MQFRLKHSEYGDIKVIEIDGEPWFVGKDIAEIMGYTNPTVAITKCVDKEDIKEKCIIYDEVGGWQGGWQRVTLISRFGLYALANEAFLTANETAVVKARKFKLWVMREICRQEK